MSFHPALRGVRVRSASFLAMLTVVLLSAATLAQDVETPKYELFVGYQWLHPGGSVPAPFGDYNAPTKMTLPDMPAGFGTAFTYNFQKYFGLEGDFGYNWDNYESTLSTGPKLSFRTEDSNFFLHTLLSYNRLNVNGLPNGNGIGAILGGGWDLRVTHNFSLRIVEADYVWARQNYASVVSAAFPDLRRDTLGGVRLRTGLVFNFGYPELVTPTASCSVQPNEVMVGEPITATATGTNFNPKHTLSYSWSATGGKVTGKDNTASIDTNGVAGGNYTVTAHITDPKKKTGGEATCTANYTVKEPPKNPPTMSCSASPSSLQAGGTATITCTCTSPDNVPVTVSNWTASMGTIAGTGSTGTLNTTGASAGTITASATCTDSRGLSSQASTQVTVENPPPPPPPQASKLAECDFANMAKIKKPWRVDNECKGKLDDVAKNLQQNADNKLIIVGNTEPTEKRKNLAAERAVNSKAYLTGGEAKLGIDPSRIETRTGSAGTMTAEYWIVPAGGTFSEAGTQRVDESVVKAVPDHPHAAATKKAKPTPKK
jgi:outer membrane protein OmpA-like peptidoglycan-associated protein